MKNLALALLAVAVSPVFAQGSGIKPGLWEVKIIKQVMDGRDTAAQMASAQAEMQRAMAGMSPAQRKQMEAMMGSHGMPAQGAAGTSRICISPAMAASDKPMVDPDGRCPPASVSRSGNTARFEINCKVDGRTMVGKGESTIASDSVMTRMDMVSTDSSGRHTMQSESQMRYLGPDCGGVKPMDQLIRKTP